MEQYLFLSFHYLFLPILADFFQCVPTYHIATSLFAPHLLIPHLIQQHPHLGRTELYLQLHIDHAKYIGYAVHLVRFARIGDAEMLAYLVFLHVGSLETAHVLGEAADFLLVEPIGETALPEVHHLTVQTLVR